MVVKPQEDERTWLKFASLCRKSGRLHLSHKTLVSILGCDPSKNPTDQPVPSHHPQVECKIPSNPTRILSSFQGSRPEQTRLDPDLAQCVELKLRWLYCVSTCPEIYLQQMFWIIANISNIRSRVGFAQKLIWNIIEEVVFEKSRKWQFLKTISLNMFQTCFWANPSRDLVLMISKMIQNFDYK